MTGEMHKNDVTRDDYPLHFAIADALGGSVEPFDVYQGPYVDLPGTRLFIGSDDGIESYVYNEATGESSSPFLWAMEDLDWVVDCAREVFPA